MTSGGNCTGETYWPLTAPCGPYGTCENNRCQCAAGYSNYGDFSVSPLAPCDLFVGAIIGLWAASLVISLANLRVALWGLTSRQVSLHTWRGWSMAMLAILQSGIAITLALLRIIGPTRFVVGGDVAFTLLHTFFIITLGCHLLIALGGFLKAHEMSKAAMLGPDQKSTLRHKVRRNMILITLMFVTLIPTGFVPLVLLSQPQQLQLVAIVHGIPLILIFIFVGAYYAPRLLASMQKGVQQTINIVEPSKRDQLERIAFKLWLIKISAAMAFPLVSIILVILMFWPYMTTKLSYILPILFSVANCATMLTVWSATTTSTNAIRRPSLPLFSRFFPRLESPDVDILKKAVVVVDAPLEAVTDGVKKTEVQEYHSQTAG